MRPRHKAAENWTVPYRLSTAILASMRPRHKAAENAMLAVIYRVPAARASMRPRHKAAENEHCAVKYTSSEISFNEAAA